MTTKTFSSRLLKPFSGPIVIPRPKDTPTPGNYYQLKHGDYLYKISKQAYKSNAHKYAQLINEHPYNKKFWHIVKSELHLFPQGRINFSKVFGSTKSQMESGFKAPAGKSDYALIWIPPHPDK